MTFARHPIKFVRLFAALLAAVGLLPRALVGQTIPTVSVTMNSTSFNAWTNSATGVQQNEPITDQQTGIPSADFMGMTGPNTTVTPNLAAGTNIPGAMVTAGKLTNGSGQQVDAMVFRFRLLDKNGNKSYVGSSLTVGFNFPTVTTDGGQMSIYLTVDSSTGGNKLFFQSPGTGLNVSPNTTSLDGGAYAPAGSGIYTKAAPLNLDSTNFNYSPVTNFAGESNYTVPGKSYVNSFVTFAVTFADIQKAVLGLYPSSGFTMDYTTEMKFIGITASQYNSINQDIQGTAIQASNNLATTWTAMDAFTDTVTAFGTKKPVPEASTVFQAGALLLAGLAGVFYRRRQAALAGEVS